MSFKGWTVAGLLASSLFQGAQAADAPVSRAEFEAMMKEVEQLRKAQTTAVYQSAPVVDKVIDNKFGPNAAVTTRSGNLKIGGLVQIWAYHIENDTRGLFDNQALGVADTNEAVDNDSFRVRRAELNFTMDIHENITSYVMIDAAREADEFGGSFPHFSGDNQGFVKAGLNNKLGAVRSGAGSVPRLLQDALINYHGVIPHHDITVGQYLPFFSPEDFGPNSVLDFVERSWIGNFYPRDIGMTIHGSWWDNGGGGFYCGGGDNGRFQYWFSAFNGTTDYLSGGTQNRSDDNDAKDFLATMLVRPIWKDCKWGSLEIGGSYGFGTHGEAGGRNGTDSEINGLRKQESSGQRFLAWLQYYPGGSLKGLWMKGEFARIKDRQPPGSIISLIDTADNGEATFQSQGAAFPVYAYFGSIGYKLSDSVFNTGGCGPCGDSGGLPSWLVPFEFAYRFQQYDQTWTQDLVDPRHTDTFASIQHTFGINYYINGHNAKVQLNYNIVDNPEGKASYSFHDVDNDSLILGLQVGF